MSNQGLLDALNGTKRIAKVSARIFLNEPYANEETILQLVNLYSAVSIKILPNYIMILIKLQRDSDCDCNCD